MEQPNRYLRLWLHASDAVYFGYLYRSAYEDEPPEDEPTQAYCLQPPAEVLTWMALAAASGIVGSASWELVRSVMRKIISQARGGEIGEWRREVEFLRDPDELTTFTKYLVDYYAGFPGVDPKIVKMILSEMVIEAELRKLYSEFREYYGEADEGATDTSAHRRIRTEDFGTVWDRVEETEF